MNNRRGQKKRRTYTLELTRVQTPKLEIVTDEVVTEKPESTGLALLLSSQQAAALSSELLPDRSPAPVANLFASGHMVDPIAHLYDFALAEPEEHAAGAPCRDSASIEEETRFPESREVYLGLLGLLNR